MQSRIQEQVASVKQCRRTRKCVLLLVMLGTATGHNFPHILRFRPISITFSVLDILQSAVLLLDLNLSDRFPVVNSLMQKINLRKRRDAIIVSLVAASCIIVLLWYVLPR